jgi:uncharacterized DUF497 family protein
MDILPEPITFEWDEGNLPKNLHKHDLIYQEAEEIFSNDPLVLTRDKTHFRSGEQRFGAFGKTKSGRRLFAAFTIRNTKIRVISVRDMTQAEEDVYENFENDT